MGAPPASALGLLAAVVCVPLLSTGCGGGDIAVEPGGGPETPARSLSAAIAVAGPISVIDPLHARTRGERLVARQVFEPLLARLRPPFERAGPRQGPARMLGPSAGGTIWTLRIRSGVRFHDGTPLNADEVLTNVQRWQASGVADELLPELLSADSPIPGQVRFRLAERVGGFPDRLADGRLGLVPAAVIRRFGVDPITDGHAGTGPFELREIAGAGALLAASADWWGSRLGLGPGVERLELEVARPGTDRLAALEAGRVQLADGLPRRTRRDLAADPLLTSIGGAGTLVGMARSVRGIDSARADQSLAGLWLTTVR